MQENHRRQNRTVYLSVDKWKLSRYLMPNYSKFPDHLFKHLLCKTIPRYRHQISQYLTNPKLLSFIQQYAHLLCIIFQLEMENDYWKHAINGLLSAVNWLSRIPKNFTKRYSINWDYPRTEHNLRHRQRLTTNKLEKANRELYFHLQQYSLCWPISHKRFRHRILTIISQALTVLIKNGLQKLHVKLEEKKTIMQFDAYDVYLLKSFYDLNPTEEQVNHH